MKNSENTNDHPFVKSAYYPGKLLHAIDFIREQEYGSRKLEFLNRKFHGWGIVEGLEIRADKDGGLYMDRGSAIDPQGRIIIVPEKKRLEAREIEGLPSGGMGDFILGIRYAERTVETETVPLEQEKRIQPAKIMESYVLRAFGEAELGKLRAEAAGMESVLTEEKVLYENEEVTVAVRVPKMIPADSVFNLRVRVRAKGGHSVHIGWRGMAKLQGAFFIQSGEPFMLLETERAQCSGCLEREWQVCTEEGRNLPVLLELCQFEVGMGHGGTIEVPNNQFYLETVASYEGIVRKYLQKPGKKGVEGDWVPIARLGIKEKAGQDNCTLSIRKENDVRVYISLPRAEGIFREIAEENGIYDLRWRGVLRHIWHAPVPPTPAPPLPVPPTPPVPPLPEEAITERQVRELIETDRKNRIRRGVVVIPIPKRRGRKRVLYSEEISHGFPGEEVMLWCGRIKEEQPYFYWEHGKKQYQVYSGADELFLTEENDWKISRQALVQNVEAGTFRIALTLTRRGRRNLSKEVAISWTAVRIG